MSDFLKLFDQRKWTRDAERFDRWLKFYNSTSSKIIKKHVKARMVELQNEWPHHKLGKIPD